MQLPALIPEEFAFAAESSNDLELFSTLSRNTHLHIQFFDYALDDETWIYKHNEFINRSLQTFTQQYTQDRLSEESSQILAKAIQEHYRLLESDIPLNLTLSLGKHAVQANALLLGTSSPYLRDVVRFQKLKFPSTDPSIAEYVVQVIHSGNFEDLWKYEKDEIQKILTLAHKWELKDLDEEAQRTLVRYLNSDNVLDEMLTSTHLPVYNRACQDYFNSRSTGIKFYPVEGGIGAEFLNFSLTSLEVFEKVSLKINHLKFSGKLSGEPEFAELTKSVKGLSLDESEIPPIEFPKKTTELDLSRCGWLSSQYLKMIAQSCPMLYKLSLDHNLQLNYLAWRDLSKWHLKILSLQRCNISDADLGIIAQSCPHLEEINLSDCKKITEEGLFRFLREMPLLSKVLLYKNSLNHEDLKKINKKFTSVELVY